jgi:N-acetylglucosaminyldiphosphoundecaprenol N-acetyl-beta-D-mannosaminyltransferase
VAERVAAALTSAHPGLRVAGCHAGSPQPADAPEIQRLIGNAQPTLLFVAYGHPAQEIWIARHQPLLNVPVAIGVGGAFDYLAGVVPLAPAWMRRSGLEWLYRLVRQPQRWRRILTAVPGFLLATWAERTANDRVNRRRS